MKHCEHSKTCEHCHEELRKAKAEASLRSGLVGELRDKLGVDHLKGEAQLKAALKRVEQLLLIEQIALACERDGLMAAQQVHVSDAEYDRMASAPLDVTT